MCLLIALVGVRIIRTFVEWVRWPSCNSVACIWPDFCTYEWVTRVLCVVASFFRSSTNTEHVNFAVLFSLLRCVFIFIPFSVSYLSSNTFTRESFCCFTSQSLEVEWVLIWENFKLEKWRLMRRADGINRSFNYTYTRHSCMHTARRRRSVYDSLTNYDFMGVCLTNISNGRFFDVI